MRRIALFSLLWLPLAALAGCGKSPPPPLDPAMIVERDLFLLTEEPTGAIGVLDLRTLLLDQAKHDAASANGAGSLAVAALPKPAEVENAADENGPESAHDEEHDHETTTQREVVVVGKIGGAGATWETGKAAFLISDPPKSAEHDHDGHDYDSPDHDGHDHDGHDHADGDQAGHDPESCPFCRKRAEREKSTALVQFTDVEGRILPVDARHLFNLEKNQTVVIRGDAALESSGQLIITARGLYVRR